VSTGRCTPTLAEARAKLGPQVQPRDPEILGATLLHIDHARQLLKPGGLSFDLGVADTQRSNQLSVIADTTVVAADAVDQCWPRHYLEEPHVAVLRANAKGPAPPQTRPAVEPD
jgi:hypothetical protein